MMKTLSLIALLLIMISCNDNGTCTGNLACTEEFRFITIELLSIDDDPILLDSSYSIPQGSEPIYFENDELLPGSEGIYMVWSDAEFDQTKRMGSEVTFEGWINNEKVVSEKFLIGHDCCHIVLLDGETTISID